MPQSKQVSGIAEPLAALSDRQQQVATLLLKGLSNKEIANTLCVSEGTIKCHLHGIYEKLGVQSRIELVLMLSNRSKSQSDDHYK
jgi:DNA-binding NarL/FixJ family response regulator